MTVCQECDFSPQIRLYLLICECICQIKEFPKIQLHSPKMRQYLHNYVGKTPNTNVFALNKTVLALKTTVFGLNTTVLALNTSVFS